MKSGSKVYAAGGNGENGSNRTGAGRKVSNMVVTPQAWQKHPKALPNDAKSLANVVRSNSRCLCGRLCLWIVSLFITRIA